MGNDIIDSISIKHMPHIVKAASGTKRIDALRQYATAILDYDKDSALSLFTITLQESMDIGYSEGECESLLDLGKIYYWQGNFNKSDSIHNLIIENKKSSRHHKIRAYTGIANGLAVQSLYEEAADNYYIAIDLLEQSKNTSFKSAYIYANVSVLWSLLGDLEKGFEYIQKAEAMAIKQNDSAQLINIYNKKGNYLILTDTAEALRLYELSFEISKDFNDLPGSLMAAGNITRVNIFRGNINKAKEYLHYMFEIMNDETIRIDNFHRLSVKNSMASYLSMLGDLQKAKLVWLEVIATARNLNARQYYLLPYENLAKLYYQMKNYDMAYKYLTMHASLKDSIVTDEKIKAVGILENKFLNIRQKRIKVAQRLTLLENAQQIARKNRTIIILTVISIAVFIFIFGTYKFYKNKNLLLKEQLRLKGQEHRLYELKAALEGKEIERKRISRELHDGIGSLLSVAKMNISILSSKEEHIEASVNIKQAINLLDVTAKNIRTIAHSLMPDILLKGGIEEAFQIFCKNTSQISNVNIIFHSYGNTAEIDTELEKNIFIFLQDVVMQILHNSSGSEINIQFNWNGKFLYITIETNGKAYIEVQEKSTEWNLLNKRIEELNGNLEAQQEQDIGTTIDIEFNLQQ